MEKPEELHQLYCQKLKTVYHAESQVGEAIPYYLRCLQDVKVKALLCTILERSGAHFCDVRALINTTGQLSVGILCKGMEGILKDADREVLDSPWGSTRDAALSSACQAALGLLAAGYIDLAGCAEQLGLEREANVLFNIWLDKIASLRLLSGISHGKALPSVAESLHLSGRAAISPCLVINELSHKAG